MKIKKMLNTGLMLLSIIGLTFSSAIAQDKAKTEKAQKIEAVKQMVDEQDYVFKAQMALPLSGGSRYLTSDYDLKVTKKELVSYLPYFGRAYTAPINPSEGGIKFKSTDFDYTITARKKGGWDVSLKPHDAKEVQQMNLTISESGYATLQVIPEQKQAITFNGYIEKNKEEKVTASDNK